MDEHIQYLETLCRLCGTNLPRTRVSATNKESFKSELWMKFRINVDLDSREIHPSSICTGCKRFLYRVRTVSDPEEVATKKEPHVWRSHTEDNCPCRASKSKGKGRPRKISKQPLEWKATETCGSETESGEDNESEGEKKYCLGFSAVMHNIVLMEKEEAVTCARKLAENYNFIFLDRDNMLHEINKLSTEDRLLLTSTIFRSEKENVKTDILSCNQTYKNLTSILNVTPHTWIQARNSVLTCAINALSHESAKPVHKAVTVDQLYSIVQPSFVSPLMFATNLLVYSVTRSKLALNIHGKIHPAGGNTTVKTWLNNLTMEVPQVPSGDILTAIDNDQVLIRKWTVHKDNRAQISVLTSVCVAPVYPNGTLQLDSNLAPG